jgi:two-component system, NtrC family, sensor kinase
MRNVCDVAKRILVIDDTESIHADFRAVLTGNQADTTTLDAAEAAIFGDAPATPSASTKTCYELDSAFQGEEGLEKVQQALREKRPYQLAFVDMRMPPGWDGLKTIEEVWRVDPNIQIVICTAYSDYSWDKIVGRLGRSDKLLILKKPFDNVEVEQLAEALTEKWFLARMAEARMSELEQAVNTRTEEIVAAQQELQQILSAATPLYVIDMDCNIQVINDTFCALFGLSVDEAIGKKCHSLMHTSTCHTPECPLQRIQNDPDVYQYEVSRENETGEETVCLATATPYFSMDYSDVIGVVVNFLDITERKKDEKAIAEANLKLGQANRELREMQSQMVQNEKLASIGQLAAGVAHEMNTPVGFVASNFQTLRSYMDKFTKLFALYEQLATVVESGAKEERLAKMHEIRDFHGRAKIDFIMGDIEDLFSDSKEGLERVTGIIQNLRDFSRIDQPQDVGEYDLNAGLKATLVVARNEVKYDADIQLDLSAVPLVTCHSGQLNQVFLNLLINAAHAIKSQERENKGTIRVRTYDTETHVVCELTDDGPGIPPAIVSKVFDPFFTTKPPGKGTGLGLSVSYDIVVNKHKGELSVDSEVGRGTTFTVKLPKQQSIIEDEKGARNEVKDRAVCG